jgi:hypothetical protein
MIRVILPAHLRTLARVDDREVSIDGVAEPITARTIVDALESTYPMLKGTIRDHRTKERRPMVRFFACERDLSHDPIDEPLPEAVAAGREPFWIVGAMSGG